MRFLNRRVRDITKRSCLLEISTNSGQNPMRIVVLVRFFLHLNKKESMFLKHYISHHSWVVYLEIQFWHFMKTAKWGWLNCVRLFLPLVTSTMSPMCGTALLPGAVSSGAQGAPQPRGDMVGYDCHVKRVLLCNPTSLSLPLPVLQSSKTKKETRPSSWLLAGRWQRWLQVTIGGE